MKTRRDIVLSIPAVAVLPTVKMIEFKPETIAEIADRMTREISLRTGSNWAMKSGPDFILILRRG